MKKKIVNSNSASAPIGPYSQAVIAGEFLFVSGQIAIDSISNKLMTSDIETETRQVMQNIQAILVEAGMNFASIVKTTIFLKDMHNFAKVNEVYGSYFSGDFPARETIEVSRLPKDVNVEISIVAVE